MREKFGDGTITFYFHLEETQFGSNLLMRLYVESCYSCTRQY